MSAAGYELARQQSDQWDLLAKGARGALQMAFPLGEGRDRDQLATAWTAAVAALEVLRTNFVRPPGLLRPLQVICEDGPATIAELTGGLAEAARAEAAAGFEPGAGPLVRASTVRTTDGEGDYLLLTGSPLVVDMESLERIGALVLGESPMPGEPLQFADYASWQGEQLQGEGGDGRLAQRHWERVPLGGQDLARVIAGERSGGRGPVVRAYRPVPGAAALGTWLAAWAVVTAQWCGEQDLCIAFAGRPGPSDDLAGAIGPYTCPLPIAVGLAPGLALHDLAGSLVKAATAAQRFALWAPQVALRSGVSARPVLNPAARALTASGLFAIELCCQGEGDDVRAELWYDDTVVEEEVALAVGDAVARLVAAASSRSWDEVDLVSDRGRKHVLDLNTVGGVAAGPVPATLSRALRGGALSAGAETVVVSGDASLSGDELRRSANQLAHLLRSKGAGPGVPVAVLLGRTTELATAIVGVLLSGAGYVPLRTDEPDARLLTLLERADDPVVVTVSALAARLGLPAERTILMDAPGLFDGVSDEEPEDLNGPDDLAYIIYTSGSTGLPKGVAVSHSNLLHYIFALKARLNLAPSGRWGILTSVTTDLGNTALFSALTGGGSIDIVPNEVVSEPGVLLAYFREHEVDLVKLTPSQLGAVLSATTDDLGGLGLIVGGERFSWDLAKKARSRGAGLIVNHYGPTETTVGALTRAVGTGPEDGADEDDGQQDVPIGRPLPGTSIYLLDGHGRPVPFSAPGELYISGPTVALGYWHDPDQTSKSFVTDPFQPSHRAYRTGDIARYRANGEVEFLGRRDSQVKIRGFRVELGEIEHVLLVEGRVAEAAVVLREDRPGVARLVGYVAGGNTRPDPDLLRDMLAQRLPEHMVPSVVVLLDQLPHTPSGKLDRASLPVPESVVPRAERAAPADEVEERLLAIWADALGQPDIGADDDFFRLGGHSLLATRVISRARAQFDLPIPLHVIFSFPTVRAMAGYIRQQKDEAERALPVESLLADVEQMSDEEAERLLADHRGALSETE